MLGAIEPTLKLAVDMGYTDRDYSDPATPTRFSLITPPKRVIETVKALPGAHAGRCRQLQGRITFHRSAFDDLGPTDRSRGEEGHPQAAPKVVEPQASRTPRPTFPRSRSSALPAHNGATTCAAPCRIVAKNVRDSLKPHPRPKHEAKPKTESDADRGRLGY